MSREGNRNQETSNETIYQHPESQSAQTQIPRHWHNDRITSNQDNRPPSELNNPTVAGPEKFNMVETQSKVFKIVTMNISEDFKDEMNKFINEIYENISKQ